MVWNSPQHSYEEIRELVVDILLRKEVVAFDPSQFGHLTAGVAEIFARRSPQPQQPHYVIGGTQRLHPNDAELVRDVFWDLFRQGFITLGMNDSNPGWPFFRLSHFGQQTLQNQKPYRFHDTSSFLAIVHNEVPDISAEAIAYLDEAVAAFYAGCLLACCVMLGVAAEAEFLRLLETAVKSSQHGSIFASVEKEKFVRSKITKFQVALKPLIPGLTPKSHFEDIDTNLSLIQSVLRISRNEAGHPTGTSVPSREQVYVFLQLFVPFARQLMRIRRVFI
jgi:hypothetical protein